MSGNYRAAAITPVIFTASILPFLRQKLLMETLIKPVIPAPAEITTSRDPVSYRTTAFSGKLRSTIFHSSLIDTFTSAHHP
jgi:hypothetical protein